MTHPPVVPTSAMAFCLPQCTSWVWSVISSQEGLTERCSAHCVVTVWKWTAVGLQPTSGTTLKKETLHRAQTLVRHLTVLFSGRKQDQVWEHISRITSGGGSRRAMTSRDTVCEGHTESLLPFGSSIPAVQGAPAIWGAAGLRAGCSFSSPLALAVHIFKNVNSITVDVTSCFSIGEKPAQAVKQTEPHQPPPGTECLGVGSWRASGLSPRRKSTEAGF